MTALRRYGWWGWFLAAAAVLVVADLLGGKWTLALAQSAVLAWAWIALEKERQVEDLKRRLFDLSEQRITRVVVTGHRAGRYSTRWNADGSVSVDLPVSAEDLDAMHDDWNRQ